MKSRIQPARGFAAHYGTRIIAEFIVTKFAHPVDQRLPLAELIPLGLQHVLVMYAGAVAVPLIIGRALKLAARTDRSFGEC